uniref:MLO-like protein n=1 Tax=Leersia perrieri TaxID=77586 RepID=A0A0D9VH79_9ORYZ
MCKNSNLSKIISEDTRSFFKQFYGSVTEEDYLTMRLGFIMKHCSGNPKFNFYKYMIRALEADFKKVVGWYVYIWISAVPFIMLLLVGTKLEHIITELAHQVAEKHSAIEGDLVVSPSDDLFWFNRPKLVLLLIHIVLFQNAFEIAFFFWLLMGTSFKKVIFDENVAEGLTNWAQNARRRNARGTNGGGVQMASPPTRSTEQGTARLI